MGTGAHFCEHDCVLPSEVYSVRKGTDLHPQRLAYAGGLELTSALLAVWSHHGHMTAGQLHSLLREREAKGQATS